MLKEGGLAMVLKGPAAGFCVVTKIKVGPQEVKLLDFSKDNIITNFTNKSEEDVWVISHPRISQMYKGEYEISGQSIVPESTLMALN